MRLGIDLDGVLAHFTRGYANLIRQTSGRDLLTEQMILDPPCWHWDLAAGYTKEEEKAAWDAIKDSATFWRDLPLLPQYDVVEDLHFCLDDVCHDHEVFFITNRMGRFPKNQSEQWLYEQGIEFPTVIVSGDKLPILKALKIEAFIDDRPETLAEVAAGWNGRLFKIPYTYNEGAPGEAVPSVIEMLRRLQGGADGL